MIAPYQARYVCTSFYFQALKTSGAKQLLLLKPEARGYTLVILVPPCQIK